MNKISVQNGVIFAPCAKVDFVRDGAALSSEFSDVQEAETYVSRLREERREREIVDYDGNERFLCRFHRTVPGLTDEQCFTMFRSWNRRHTFDRETDTFTHNKWLILTASSTTAEYGRDNNVISFSYHSRIESARVHIRGVRLTSPDSTGGKAIGWGTLKQADDIEIAGLRVSPQSTAERIDFDGADCWSVIGDGHLIWLPSHYDVFPAGTANFTLQADAYFDNPNVGEIADVNTGIQLEPLDNEDRWMDGIQVSSVEEALDIRQRGHKAWIRQQLSAACNATILGGIDLGSAHYSLKEEDQINIGNLAAAAAQGQPVLYHADGELCRAYPPEEFGALAAAATRHKILHTTYYNHLKAWVDRAEPEELAGIEYGSALPQDLAAHMNEVLEAVEG